MKLTAWLLVLAPALLQAQADPPTSIELDKLRTPTSPAFSLLGVNPSVIARPATPRALATELVSSSSRGTVIPNNYAMEVAPYWLTPKPALTYAAYLEPTTGQSFRESFSVSLATARPDSGADSALTQIAFGVRTAPRGGKASAKFQKLGAQLTAFQDVRLDSVDKYLNDTTMKRADSTKLVVFLDKQAASMRVIVQEMATEERVGFFWDLAGAVAAAFPGEDFDAGRFSRLGVWTTVSYRVEAPRIDFISLLRLMRNVREDGQNAFDVGGRLHWARGDLGISSEWVSRTAFKLATSPPASGTTQATITFTSSSRAVAVVDYRAADELYVTMSFGKDYRALGQDRHPLVAKVGMQFSYGRKPVVLTP